MTCISNNPSSKINRNIFSEVENAYSITLREDIKTFLVNNSGGYPVKDMISADGDEYEVRVFLSLDDSDEYYYIQKPIDFFLAKTNGKIVPIGIDSGDNYFCVNNETGKVYYWSSGEDSYYCISNSLNDFVELFV